MDEYVRLYNEFIAALVEGGVVLQRHGMDSPEFLEAERKSGAIYVKLKQMRNEH